MTASNNLKNTKAAALVERLSAQFLNHSIISPPCFDVCVRAPHWPHMIQAVLLARGGPRSRVVKSPDNLLPHLLAGVSDGFSRGAPVFAPPADWRVSYELKNLERDDKLNKKIYSRE